MSEHTPLVGYAGRTDDIETVPLKKLVGVPPAVVLINPKYAHNVGSALRSCACWGVEQLWWTGGRVSLDVAKGERLPREERMKGYQSVRMCQDDKPFDRFEGKIVPVAIELRPGSELLDEFEHPENAVYVFGPEDGSIYKPFLYHCHRFVVIPTHHCLNLSAAINVVLYDRRLKRRRAGLEPPLTTEQMLKEHRGFV